MYENAFYARFGGSGFFALLLIFSLTRDHQSQKIQKKFKKISETILSYKQKVSSSKEQVRT